MLNKPTSFNGKLVLEAYKHTEVKGEIKHGWATVNQKNNLKGLKVLVDAYVNQDCLVPRGSVAYIKEEFLHTQQWAKNKLKCDTLEGEFILVTMNEVEYIVPPGDSAA